MTVSGTSAIFAALAVGGLLTACGGTSPARAAQITPSGPPIESVRPALHTLEDSLVLDILIGYQEVAAGKSDREILRRARSAQNQLDYMLRHGGVKDRGGEGRVYEIPAGEKATLGELTSQMSRELMRSPTGDAEAERALEIRRHRMDLSFLAEDAEWVLALDAAMDGPLPEEDKRSLRRLHEAYGNHAPHSLIATQVTALLKTVQDERLRKELKKLANRSWEREKRAKEPADPVTMPKAGAARIPIPTAPVPDALPLPDFDTVTTATPASDTSAAPSAGTPDSSTPGTADSPAKVDSLTTPDRYCEERRAEAAEAFASARAATGENRAALLRRSLAALDDCLQHYPDSKGAEKARGNRDRVEKELKQTKEAKAK